MHAGEGTTSKDPLANGGREEKHTMVHFPTLLHMAEQARSLSPAM